MALGFLTNKEAQEQIAALEAQILTHDEAIQEANTARDEALNAVQAITAERDEARQELEVIQGVAESRGEENQRLRENVAQLESENRELNERLEADETRIAEAASEELAAAGHEPVEVTEAGNADGSPVSVEHYESLEGKEKAQYLAEHGDELRRLAQKQG